MKNLFAAPLWSELSGLGENRLVTRTYLFLPLVPFLVRILSKIEIAVDGNGDKFHLLQAIPFSWKVFFWCAFFFTFGSVLYQLFAPKIIRENRTWYDFENSGKTWGHLMTYVLELGIDYDKWRKVLIDVSEEDEYDQETFLKNHSKNDRIQLEFVLNNMHDFSSTHYPQYVSTDPPETSFQKSQAYKQSLKENAEENTKTTFWNIFGLANNYNKLAKLICYISFIVGFLLLAWLLLRSVWIVLTKTVIT